MSEEDVMKLVKSYEDFMKNSDVKELRHEIHTAKHHIIVDGVEVEIPDEDQLISSYEKKAAELDVTVDYYMEEFL
jgi:hypothetical protein